MAVVMEQISDVLVNAIVEHLTKVLQTDVEKSDPCYVADIQGGRLQDDPIQRGKQWGHTVTVHIGDPDIVDDSWVDSVATSGDPYVPQTPMFEIGGGFGGVFWWRRGVVQISSFFVNKPEYDRDYARRLANELRRRVEIALGENQGGEFLGLKDYLGREQVVVFLPVKSRAQEAGGPNQHIWRSKIWWQALTSRM